MNIRNLDDLQLWWRDLDFSKNQRRVLFIFAIIALLLSGAYIFWPDSNGAAIKPMVINSINTAPPLIVIDVTGEVNKPGVYKLPPDSRVMDAIHAAGEAKSSADLTVLNLARPIKDGEQIYVDRKFSPSAIAKHNTRKATTVNGPLNINRASIKELDKLPGIGPVIASRIIEYRNTNGLFSSIEDLKKVSGIGASKFEKIKEHVRV